MPKGFTPHYDNFLGYTMPLVIRVLEKEYPDRFSDIPEPFVGPLKVTLAQDLAISARHVVFEGSRQNFLDRLRVRLLTKYGGREYTEQAALLEDALDWRASTQTALALIDREAYPYYDRHVRDWPLERISPGPTGTPVRWVYSELERPRVDDLRARINALLEAVPRSREAVDQQKKVIEQLEREIEARPGYAEEFSSFKWRLSADFSTAMKWQEDGAPHYLRNLEHKWWYRFTEAFEAEERLRRK